MLGDEITGSVNLKVRDSAQSVTEPMPRRASIHRFENLWSRCCGATASSVNRSTAKRGSTDDFGSAELGTDLLHRYGEAGRVYHTIDHIDHCLGQFDQVRSQCVQPDAVELAIWFHDAIYNFPAYENEKLSAAFFTQQSEKLLLSGFREDVAALIIATEHLSLIHI